MENYPGVLSAPGAEIMNNFREHALASGSEILDESVTKLEQISSLTKGSGESGFKVTTYHKNRLCHIIFFYEISMFFLSYYILYTRLFAY